MQQLALITAYKIQRKPQGSPCSQSPAQTLRACRIEQWEEEPSPPPRREGLRAHSKPSDTPGDSKQNNIATETQLTVYSQWGRGTLPLERARGVEKSTACHPSQVGIPPAPTRPLAQTHWASRLEVKSSLPQ